MSTVPDKVIRQDQRLTKAGEELAELRWRWTLDETNPDRVSFTEYAGQVGAHRGTVARYAHGYAAWLAAQGKAAMPGQPQTVGDFVELAKLDIERKEAAKAVSRHSGKGVRNGARHKRSEVDNVLNAARERAASRGTTLDHEIDRAAERRERARRAAQKEQDERRRAATQRYLEIEGHIGVVLQRLRKVLDAAQEVPFSDEEKELLVGSIAKARGLLGLVEMRVAGSTDVDWDAELERLVR
jgi:hypothetical protein